MTVRIAAELRTHPPKEAASARVQRRGRRSGNRADSTAVARKATSPGPTGTGAERHTSPPAAPRRRLHIAAAETKYTVRQKPWLTAQHI